MTSDNTPVEAKLPSEDKSNFGEQLKTTRESMGLSAQEAAVRLHLSPRFIHLLENEDLLQSTLPPIYLRGYLRSYARLLNIPEQDVAAILEKLAPTPAILTSPTVSPDSLALSFPLETNPYYRPIATFFVSLVLLTSLTTWWYLHSNTSSTTIIASRQTLAPEQIVASDQTLATNQNSTYEPVPISSASTLPSDAKNMALGLTAAPSTPTEPLPSTTPTAAHLPTSQSNPQLALAANAGERINDLATSSLQPVAKHLTKHPEQEEGDDNIDEQE